MVGKEEIRSLNYTKTGPTKVKVKEESIYYTISFYIENDLVYVLVDFKISPVDMYHYR